MVKFKKIESFVEDAINKMLELCGSPQTYAELIKEGPESKWYTSLEWGVDDLINWRLWFIAEAKKRRIFPARRISKEFEWINLMYGPRMSPADYNIYLEYLNTSDHLNNKPRRIKQPSKKQYQ